MYLHLHRGVHILLNMEIVNGYWNLMKLKPMIWIMVYGFSVPFMPRPFTPIIAVLLLFNGGLSVYIWSIKTMPWSTKNTESSKSWNKSNRGNSQCLRLSLISCTSFQSPRNIIFSTKWNLIVPKIYHFLGWIYLQSKSTRVFIYIPRVKISERNFIAFTSIMQSSVVANMKSRYWRGAPNSSPGIAHD